MHGGLIELTSEFGVGSDFTIWFPIRASEPPLQSATTSDGAALGTPTQPDSPASCGVNILCIDDEPDSLKYLKLTFETAGYAVQLAADADTAIAQARRSTPDLLCLDLNVHGKEECQVIEALRDHVEPASVPVVVVSACGNEIRRYDIGALSYLTKPVSPNELQTAVRDLLQGDIGSVLVIDDDPDIVKLWTAVLSKPGTAVRSAANGAEGLEQLHASIPDVIVLDLMMPNMDGFQFLTHIRNDASWRSIPVVVATAKTLQPDEVVRLGQLCTVLLAKSREHAEEMIQAILQTLPSTQRIPEGAAT